MMSSPDARDYSTKSTLRQAVSVTRLFKRVTSVPTREASYRTWSERLKA